LSKENTPLDFPKPPLVQGRKEKMTVVEQSRRAFLEVVTKEQGIYKLEWITFGVIVHFLGTLMN
jgi:hypothetical protein